MTSVAISAPARTREASAARYALSSTTGITGVIMLTAVKLVDQWSALERRLPRDWETSRSGSAPSSPTSCRRQRGCSAPMSVGRVGDELAFTVRRAGGAAGPEAARRLFRRARRDARSGASSSRTRSTRRRPRPAWRAGRGARAAASVARGWDAALAELPVRLERPPLLRSSSDSSALLARAALLCAPLNPARDRDRVGFTFRCARRAGYGVSPAMARRCFERLDEEGIPGTGRGAARALRRRQRRHAGRRLVRRRAV